MSYRNRYGIARIVRDKYSNNKASWDEIRQRVLERDQFNCTKCGTNLIGKWDREVHHIIPLSRGGKTVMSNLITLCGKCHKLEHRHLRNTK
jgi:5-methylcytosine-specific restriction endonuclease McrA